MDFLYFPIIDEDDFESFRNIMHDELPTSHKEWLQRQTNRIAHYRETHRIVYVKVKASDFSAYSDAGSHGNNLKSLWDFAEFIAKRSKN